MTPEAVAWLCRADPIKALVLASIGRSVTDGHALWWLERRCIRVAFQSGEEYLLSKDAVSRLK